MVIDFFFDDGFFDLVIVLEFTGFDFDGGPQCEIGLLVFGGGSGIYAYFSTVLKVEIVLSKVMVSTHQQKCIIGIATARKLSKVIIRQICLALSRGLINHNRGFLNSLVRCRLLLNHQQVIMPVC